MASFKNNGKLKLLIIVGTRPEIIRLAAVINKCRTYFDCILAHTGQNYDYNLNGVFFKDLKLADPEVYLDAVGDDLGATMGNIIDKSYKLMVQLQPDAVLVLGDTNSCLSVIGAKRLHIPIFHMEAGNRCFDECLPEETNRRIVDIISDVNICYSEHARRYLNATNVAPQRTYVSGSPMAEVCIIIWLILRPVMYINDWVWRKANTFCLVPIERRILTRRKTSCPCSMLLTKWLPNMICRYFIPAIRVRGNVWNRVGSSLIRVLSSMNLLDSTIITACR